MLMPQARVVQNFKTSPAEIFDAWLDPKLIGQWMFGPALREEEVLRISVDARLGGSFSFLVRRQGTEIDHIGNYLEFNRPNHLAFTWGTKGGGANSRVDVRISATSEGCELTLTHELDPDWAHYLDRVEESWKKMISVLAGIEIK
jgi:uncharacterized protein YndB with AHSA1/START domain